jgi:hypothetical protein
MTLKQHPKYLKEMYKKVHKMNKNMVLSYQISTLQFVMLPKIKKTHATNNKIYESSYNGQPLMNTSNKIEN